MQSVTLEILIKKFKNSDLSLFPDVYSYRTIAEPVMWTLWVIQEKFKIDAHIPASMIADILVDGLGKSTDKNLVKKALARVGNKVNRKIVDGEPAYKIMKDGINYLKTIETNPKVASKVKIYKAGDQYDLYKDLAVILKTSSKEVFIVDTYPDESFYDLYVDIIPSSVNIRILTHKPPQKFIALGKMVKLKRTLDVVDSQHIHDRYIFVDNKCWALGSSIKSAGKSKPTTLLEITTGRNELYVLHDNYFKTGIMLV